MLLKSLYLRHFRNYEEAYIEFGPKINIIQGGNAQGKTNLLEAIYFLSTGRSFRTSHLKDLIKDGHNFFYLEARFLKDDVSQVMKLSFDGTLRKMQYNQNSYASFVHLLGLLPHILYAPEDVAIISGAPAERRRFIDLYIAQADPLYVYHLGRYYKAMKQRNFLLRTRNLSTIQSWEAILSQAASYIFQKRMQTLSILEEEAAKAMRELSKNEESLTLEYAPSFSLEKISGDLSSFIYGSFEKNRKKEMEIGSTLIGPHRDDIFFNVDGKQAKLFASEGQKRCCITALRLAQWRSYKTTMQLAPLFSIDDFGSHLDLARHSLLQSKLKDLGQIFLTSPVSIQEFFSPSDIQVLQVEKGLFI